MLLPLGFLGSFLLNNFLKETYSSRKLELEKSIENFLDKNVDLGDYVGIRFLGISLGNSKIYDKKNIDCLLSNNKIIRNKKKIIATIYNSKIFIEIIKDNGSFKNWMDKNKSKSLDQWIQLFKKKFKFTGPSVTREFLVATGYIAGAHDLNCIYYKL